VELLVPSPATLKKYGLSLTDWQAIADTQGGVCAICRRLPTSGRLVIDHEHVPKWKKMPPEQRKTYVRGLICWFDNYYLVRKGVTPERARRAAEHLEAYGARRPN
jgi:hypothetical protein